MSGYKYRGHHTGPDLFDTPTNVNTPTFGYEKLVRAERAAAIGYWYAQGFMDSEICERVGCSGDAVSDWRRKRGLRSNYELIVAI